MRPQSWPPASRSVSGALTCFVLQVDLACKILDGAPLRDSMTKPMSVQPAKFEQKGEEFVAKKKPNKKKKAAAAIQKQEKVLGWGGFDDKMPPHKVGWWSCKTCSKAVCSADWGQCC